ncbi:DUF4140 domain-containing protein [Trichlorobacter ammonificans]|uniref:DUF4140 domain-containing protein n=1 Tax=Trichlorobacter ammonificans TaxID=2916410 RepID=A0ABM9D933_9BACT|nr:DUF4140 domain-containing protein [Trichlorobacter ammonificans]CAH2031735.1 conserved exported protein of unknown function [Trichlorobacter ammonificans]
MNVRHLLIVLTYFVMTSTAMAAPREITVYSDGILIEQEVTVRKGGTEFSLPAPIRENSLRVKPLDGGSIGRVELVPFRLPEKQQKELDSLTEQKSRLEDRLKALDTREEIFAAAAKSQSSKTPRKTKTNPDPLAAVRQGTDFAIAQLEAVNTSRRRTIQELKRVEARLAAVQKAVTGGPTVRITAPAPRIRIAAVLAEGAWTPSYDIRLQGDGFALLTLLARLPVLPEGYAVRVVNASLGGSRQEQALPVTAAGPVRLAQWRLPVEQERTVNAPLPSCQFLIRNNSGTPLAAGEAALYVAGEYLGTVLLPALAGDATAKISLP